MPVNGIDRPVAAGVTGTAFRAAAKTSTSSVVIRLPGALGGTRAISTPRSRARRRAAGEASTSDAAAEADDAAPEADGAAPTGCDVGAGGAEARAALSSSAGGKLSPGPPMRARSAPTGSSVPGGARTLPNTPEPGDSTTALIFSVMISSSGFPCSAVPPSATSHRFSVPFFIAIPSLGMRTSVSTGASEGGADRAHYPLGSRHVEVLEWRRKRDRRVRGGHRLGWGVQVVEGLRGDQGHQVGCQRAARVVLVDHNEPSCLPD